MYLKRWCNIQPCSTTFISFSTSNLELLKQCQKIALFKNEIKKFFFFLFLRQGLTVERIGGQRAISGFVSHFLLCLRQGLVVCLYAGYTRSDDLPVILLSLPSILL